MALSYSARIDDTGIIESKIGMCLVNALRREGYSLAPSDPSMTALTPSAEQSRKLGVEVMKSSGLSFEQLQSMAVEEKRQGNLQDASKLYGIVCYLENPYTKTYIWGWIKVMLLAKNFEQAELLLRYLYCFNVRLNLLRMADGESLSDYAAWGSIPPTDFRKYEPRGYLEQVSDRSFSSLAEAEESIRGYGGSEFWNREFFLTPSEYQEFLKCFWVTPL